MLAHARQRVRTNEGLDCKPSKKVHIFTPVIMIHTRPGPVIIKIQGTRSFI